MFDASLPRDRIVQATLALAAEHDWSDITFARIAEDADVTLADTRALFDTRGSILRTFSSAVDAEVLRRIADEGDDGDVARDRLFDTLMTRFEVLTPYKGALKRLSDNSWTEPSLGFELMPSILNGQRWMLEAAGIDTGGATGSARVLGASAVYAQVVRTWLSDDDAGMAKTMAALDSRLRRGEKTIGRIDDAFSLLKGLGSAIFSRRRTHDTQPPMPPDDTPPPADKMEPA